VTKSDLRPTERARGELDEAEHIVGSDPIERRRVGRALAMAVVLHVTVLVARMPDLGPDPVRVDAPRQQEMKVQFLKPPPPPPKTPPKPPEPERKKIPRPDPTPDEPEPIKPPPPPPPTPEVPVLTPQAVPGPPQEMGPVRVSPGQGPGLIKKVEPQYPPMARTARIEGTVVVDAIIRKDGSVSDVTIVKSSNVLFNQPSIDAVRQWRFTPSPQDVILTVTVKFTLR
jgi:protein TonB